MKKKSIVALILAFSLSFGAASMTGCNLIDSWMGGDQNQTEGGGDNTGGDNTGGDNTGGGNTGGDNTGGGNTGGDNTSGGNTGGGNTGGDEKPQTVAVTKITIAASSVLEIKGVRKLTATVEPSNATNKDVTWHSDNPSVAKVASDGTVTAVAAGKANITAKASDGSNVTSNACQVTVNAAPEPAKTYKVTFMSEGKEVGSVTAEENTTVTAPSGVTKDGYYLTGWYTSETSGAQYDFSSKVTGSFTLYARWEKVSEEVAYSYAGCECAAFEWGDANPADASVMYKKSDASGYTEVDKALIRSAATAGMARVDVVGLQKNTNYDFKIIASTGKVTVINGMAISAYDRSGYAHFNYTSGVGAYTDEGVPKSGARIVYVTEANKNTVKLGNSTGIVDIIKNEGKSKPLIVRIIGTVGAATWNKLDYNADKKYSQSNPIPKSEVKGINGNQLPQAKTSQASLIAGGYNTLDESVYSELYGLDSNLLNSSKEYDSCWNDCSVEGAKNVTIEGIGEDARIFQWGMTFKKSNSIEVRNLTFEDYTEDACSFEGSGSACSDNSADGFTYKNYWVHHNVFEEGINYWDVCSEQDKHDGDGSTDIKRVSYVTFAYNVYHNTHKTGLVGSDDTVYTAAVTFHHNYYNECKARLPLARQANMHMYNNYYYNTTGTSFSLRGGAYAFAENCYFSHTKDGVDVELRDGAAGIGSAKLLNCKFADDERHLTIGVAPDNYLETTDRSATVNTINNYGGGNGANFDLNSDVFYYKEGRSDVTNMLTAEETKEQVPQLAGVQKRKNGTGGGTIGDGEGDNTGGGDNTGDTGDETAPITKTVNLSGNKAENDVIFDMSDKRGVSIAKVTLNFSATGKGGATLVNADGTTESVSSHIQTGFKSCFLIELADGYVYTVKLYVGSSSGTQSKTISINDTEFSTGIGTNCEELTWALTSGTYSSTESGTVRLARIVITATPLSK